MAEATTWTAPEIFAAGLLQEACGLAVRAKKSQATVSKLALFDYPACSSSLRSCGINAPGFSSPPSRAFLKPCGLSGTRSTLSKDVA